MTIKDKMEKLIRAKKEQELTLFLHTAGKEARHRETLLTVEVVFFHNGDVGVNSFSSTV